jgi:hypothetical protein
VIPADDLANIALEGAALAQAQSLVIYNPAAEAGDSLAELVVALRRYDVPEQIVRDLLDKARRLLDLSDRQRHCHARLAGELDRFTRAGAQLTDAITVRSIVRTLRDPLTTLLAPEQAGAAEITNARTVVRNLIDTVPRDRLFSATIAHELGGRRHRLLIRLADGDDA